MENTLKERLIEFIKSEGLSQNKFEKRMGFSNGYINSISRGIGGDKLQRIISEFPRLNSDWLISGEGEMSKPYKDECGKDTTFEKSILNAISAVKEIAESNRILAESNHDLTTTNKILATSNTELVQKLAVLMDEIREKKAEMIKYPPFDKQAQVASDVDPQMYGK